MVAAVPGAVRHKGNRFCVNRDPRARQPLSSFFFLPFPFSFYPLLPRAILSFRICDHQHAKWIKFLDYTLRSPFLYLLPIPILGRLAPRRLLSSLPSRITPTVSQIVSPHLRISVPCAVSSIRVSARSFSLHSTFLYFFFVKEILLFSFLRSHPWAIFSNLAILWHTNAPYQLF